MTPRYGTDTPISYTNPVDSLRYGGDVTKINTVGNLNPAERIKNKATNIFEQNQAKRQALAMSMGQREKDFGAIRGAYADVFGQDPMEKYFSGQMQGATLGNNKGSYGDWYRASNPSAGYQAYQKDVGMQNFLSGGINRPEQTANSWNTAVNARKNFSDWATTNAGYGRNLRG